MPSHRALELIDLRRRRAKQVHDDQAGLPRGPVRGWHKVYLSWSPVTQMALWHIEEPVWDPAPRLDGSRTFLVRGLSNPGGPVQFLPLPLPAQARAACLSHDGARVAYLVVGTGGDSSIRVQPTGGGHTDVVCLGKLTKWQLYDFALEWLANESALVCGGGDKYPLRRVDIPGGPQPTGVAGLWPRSYAPDRVAYVPYSASGASVVVADGRLRTLRTIPIAQLGARLLDVTPDGRWALTRQDEHTPFRVCTRLYLVDLVAGGERFLCRTPIYNQAARWVALAPAPPRG